MGMALTLKDPGDYVTIIHNGQEVRIILLQARRDRAEIKLEGPPEFVYHRRAHYHPDTGDLIHDTPDNSTPHTLRDNGKETPTQTDPETPVSQPLPSGKRHDQTKANRHRRR